MRHRWPWGSFRRARPMRVGRRLDSGLTPGHDGRRTERHVAGHLARRTPHSQSSGAETREAPSQGWDLGGGLPIEPPPIVVHEERARCKDSGLVVRQVAHTWGLIPAPRWFRYSRSKSDLEGPTGCRGVFGLQSGLPRRRIPRSRAVPVAEVSALGEPDVA